MTSEHSGTPHLSSYPYLNGMKKLLILGLFAFGLIVPVTAQDYARQREMMVQKQLAARGISSKAVLDVMRIVERHLFVPTSQVAVAYQDSPLPIGAGQTISQPYIVAFMTEALKLKPTDVVLEVGTGSGYQAAILGKLCREVYTVEIIRSLGMRSDSLLRVLGYSNIHVRVGDGYAGWPEAAPFDAIIVTCSPTHVPRPLQEQLKEGGRMIIPVGEGSLQELVFLTKRDGKITRENQLPVLFVPMKDSKGKRY